MGIFQDVKKLDLMKAPSVYYSEKFDELNLTKRSADYQDAFSKLKDEYKFLYTYNENICVKNIKNMVHKKTPSSKNVKSIKNKQN